MPVSRKNKSRNKSFKSSKRYKNLRKTSKKMKKMRGGSVESSKVKIEVLDNELVVGNVLKSTTTGPTLGKKYTITEIYPDEKGVNRYNLKSIDENYSDLYNYDKLMIRYWNIIQ